MPPTSTPRASKPKAAQAFTRRLLAWFRRAGRDLPWRRTRDPYRVLVSEFMLQQTQVSRVADYYPRFLKRFGSLERLARARPRAVREAWDGLGYYARARNLHALAKEVTGGRGGRGGRERQRAAEGGSGGRERQRAAEGGNGGIPSDPAELMKLPGVGRYTAGAVASFAYERPVPAVDTNVARVLRRVFWGDGNKTGEGRREKDVWVLAEALVPRQGKRAWTFNQAVMELGAVICVARKPKCGVCPVRGECRTGRGRRA